MTCTSTALAKRSRFSEAVNGADKWAGQLPLLTPFKTGMRMLFTTKEVHVCRLVTEFATALQSERE